MDARVRELLVRYEPSVRNRHWKRLAHSFSRELGRKVTPAEVKHYARGTPVEPKLKVNIDTAKNGVRIVEAIGGNSPIKTLDELLAAAQVDPEVWSVAHWTANTWTNGGRNNWQVKAHLVRCLDLDDFLQSITPSTTSYRAIKPAKEGSLLVIPDCQLGLFWREERLLPYHDRLAMDTIWKVAQRQQPGTIVIAGDFLDLAIWSTKFQREPKDRYTTKYALREARWWLTRLRKECPNSRIVFLEGNHEKRIHTVLVEFFQELSTLDLVDVPRLLGLKELGIEYRGPYGSEATYFFEDRVIGLHGDIARQGGGATSAHLVKGNTTSLFCGHTHRLGFSSRAIHTPKGVEVITAMEVGCACRLDGAVPGDSSPDWAHGYGWITCKDGRVFQSPMTIQGGVTLTPDGGLIQGIDCSPEIMQVLGEERLQ